MYYIQRIQDIQPAYWVGATLLVLVLLLFFWLTRSRLSFASKPLLTANEREFYGRLEKALPDFHIFPQVALRAIVRPGSPSHSKWYAMECGRIGAKHCDFLICRRKDMTPIAIIELDDRTHSAEKDAVRDAMTASAGYVTLRYWSAKKPEPHVIRQDILKLASLK